MGKRNRQRDNYTKYSNNMAKKLAVYLSLILVAFVYLGVRLFTINADKGDTYKRQVLSQQSYDSITLPAKRGEIIDRNGTKIAVSEKVYNVVISAKTLNGDNGSKIESTLNTLYNSDISFQYTRDEVSNYIVSNPGSQYRVIAKKQTYEAVSNLMEMINNASDYPDFTGVWLEETYRRQYPYNSMACDVLGFVQGNNEGAYGLEEYYNDVLVGTNGREYGYLNDDENLERTVKPAIDGQTLITSLDINIQSIVEKHIKAFNDEHANEVRDGYGAKNIGVMVMNPNNGEILAMASYPVFNLNDPRNTDGIELEIEVDPSKYGIVKPSDQDSAETVETSEGEAGPAENADSQSDSDDENNTSEGEVGISIEGEASPEDFGFVPGGEYFDEDGTRLTYEEAYDKAYEEAKLEALAGLWRSFCISDTYEPGSTMKPFTMAAGLEEGKLRGDESYVCNGSLQVGDHLIHCANRLGHGELDFSGALEQSCNVALMKMAAVMGKDVYMKYNSIYNFGLKTNIDITGEALTNNLVFDVNNMTPTDLAISSFGQGFNVTMVQMITGFCSLINGGYYYKPHLVTKIIDSDGAVVQSIEPRVMKQTISEETSAKIKEMCVNVVSKGTGKSARPAGYMIGGKTGTAEKYPRGRGNYVVSFMGFAPADDPQIVTYVVIDEPNVDYQASSKYATVLTRDIMTEVLPYLNIFQTEELTDQEAEELAEKQLDFSAGVGDTKPEESEQGEEQTADNHDEYLAGGAEEDTVEKAITIDDNTTPASDEEVPVEAERKIDPETGYIIDSTTGILLDPTTGQPVDGTVSDLE